MIWTFVVLLGLALVSCKPLVKGFYEGYLSKEQTCAINGLFIVWVFIRHIQFPYMIDAGYEYVSFGDRIFRIIDDKAGQLIVATFLFYSGYGVMSAIKEKGMSYVRAMPINRILITWLNFAIAIFAFIGLSFVIGKEYSIRRCVAALFAWEDVGNSHWYIFAMLFCYSATWLVAMIRNDRAFRIWPALTIIIGLYLYLMPHFKWACWSDTICCYLLGLLFAEEKHWIEPIIKRKYSWIILSLAFIFVVLKVIPFDFYYLKANLAAGVFALFVVLLSMKFVVRGALWFGAHLFPIYIYQRFAMKIAEVSLGQSIILCYTWVFVSVSFLLTCMIALVYRFWQVKPEFVGRVLGDSK